jgi:hypothetical protein
LKLQKEYSGAVHRRRPENKSMKIHRDNQGLCTEEEEEARRI